MDGKFAVLLDRPELYDPPLIAKILSKLRGVPLHDVLMWARTCSGFIMEDVDEPAARDLAGRLLQEGLAVRAVPESAIPVLPPAQAVTAVDLFPDRFELAIGEARRVIVRPGALRFLSAGAFSRKTLRTFTVDHGPTASQKIVKWSVMLATGLPLPIGGKAKPMQKTVEESDLVFCADLVLREPFERFRIEGQNISYACLKDKMVYNVMGNFPVLVRELLRVAPDALLGRGARVIQRSGPQREAYYDSLEEMERESRWLLALASG